MPIISSAASASARGYGFNGNLQVPGNSGILTAGTSYTLPATSGATINILVIAPGGGGGGGSGRTSFAGYFTGGGGGGSGGNAYVLGVLVVPGQTITYSLGSGGTAGTFRDGIYSSGSNGGAGGSTTASVNGSTVVAASGGGGGLVAPNATGGAAGGVVTGTQLLAPNAGGTAVSSATTGGVGSKGFNINTTVGTVLGSLLSYGSDGTTTAAGSSTSNTAGTGYGAGGSGGGCSQSDEQPYSNIFSNAGLGGAVFIWWGY